MEAKEVRQALGTDQARGLTRQEAKRRLEEMGRNELAQSGGKRNLLFRFLAQFQDFMILLLLGAAAVSVLLSWHRGDGEYLDAVIIMVIVVFNALLGTIQESKAEKALEALKNMSAPTASVLREGQVCRIPAAEVVPGDLVLLSAGDYICADGRVVESNGMKTEESAVTGESMAVEKESDRIFPADTPLGDRKNMVLSGGYVLSGRGRMVVTATGMETEVGRIAHLLSQQEDSETPLQKKLARTGQLLGVGALAICAFIFCLGILQQKPPFQMFMTSVSLAVAAIPEGLPAIVTIVLALGTQRLSKRNTIVRRLPAVETLGGAEVICSDKTGTLTQNRMQVKMVTGGTKGADQKQKERILTFFALCSDCRMEKGKLAGEPTELALAEAALAEGISPEELWREMPREGEIPFSSARKRMTTLHRTEEGGWITVTKGAPEYLLERCDYVMEGDRQAAFDSGRKSKAQLQNGEMAAKALRVVAAAFRLWDRKPEMTEEVERHMVFAGMAGMEDPPRKEAMEAVRLCRQAGIRPVMITGDHVLTAEAVASQLGILEKGGSSMTGAQLEAMDEEALAKAAAECSVFARVAPEHKVRIVKALQKAGYVVAMTGDGVNDAPALKAADIGCAMGKSGTEVAKGASDLILTDDNFATIVTAVEEGRGIYDNIRKAVHFLLSSNIGEILTILGAMVLGWQTPLLPIQLLWVNLVTDSLPAVALGLEPVEKDCMCRPPRKEKSLFSGGLGSSILVEGLMIGMLALLAFGIGYVYFDRGGEGTVGRTMAFAVLSLSQLVHAFNMRSEHSLFRERPLGNPWLVGAFLAGTLLQCGAITLPFCQKIFGTAALDGTQWLATLALAFAPLPIVELEKLLRKKRGKTEAE